MKDEVVIVGAARTPVGAFNGAFGSLPAHELGKAAITEALKRAGVEGGRVSEVILGQILTAAWQTRRGGFDRAGIPWKARVGVTAVRFRPARGRIGYQAILNGDSEMWSRAARSMSWRRSRHLAQARYCLAPRVDR